MSEWRLRGPAWLFVPADHPDRIRKALASADHVVIDLEDAVDPAARPTARAGLVQATAGADLDRLIVRVNRLDSPDATADLAAARAAAITTIMVPKAEDAAELSGSVALDGFHVVVLCESARGVLRAEQLAAARRVVAIMWGSVDLAADLGCHDEDPVLFHARHQIRYAARAARCVAVDRACPDLTDDVVADDARSAAGAGYDAKAVLHPRHVPSVAAAFAPGPDEVAWAERVIEAADGHGAQTVDGRFIDEAVLALARRTLARRSRTS